MIEQRLANLEKESPKGLLPSSQQLLKEMEAQLRESKRRIFSNEAEHCKKWGIKTSELENRFS